MRFGRGAGEVFPAPGQAVPRRRESCLPAPGKSHIHSLSKKRREKNVVVSRGSCVSAPGKLFPGAGEKSHSFNMEEKFSGFPGAGGSCVPAPGKLFPGAGKKSHSCTTENNV